MVNVCQNGTMMANTNNYSSPVPVVGLYIAAASFVCFLLIVCDVWAGFRSKKFWFPCRFFSINSITLSLISIATKLPVDLTTDMPNAEGQLSKLSGTVFICMTMGFMLPSLAVNAEFESYANVTALSIFVVTVAVNICMQMATGVIFSFIAEHVIVLVCMCMLLIKFGTSLANVHGIKEDYTDRSKDLIRRGNKMSKRLQVCYLYGYHYCLQLISCRTPFLADVAAICMICLVVLVQAMFRSLGLKDIKFCGETSDYGWSVWLVVVSQVLTVAAVGLAVGARLLINPLHFIEWYFKFLTNISLDYSYLRFQYFFSSRNLPKVLEKGFRYVLYYPLDLVSYVVKIPNFYFQIILGYGLVECGILKTEDEYDEKLHEFETLLRSRGIITNVETWVLKKGVVDMERWMKITRKASFQHLTNLLCTIPPSVESSSIVGLNYQGVNLSTLSMILLAETAKATITPTLRNKVSLANILAEVFDIIHFVESKLYIGSSEDRLRYILAQIIHEYGFVNGVGELDLVGGSDIEKNPDLLSFSPKPLCWFDETLGSDAIGTIRELLRKIAGVIFHRSHESGEVWYGSIEQLFVDMIHIFLSKLPVAIFTHITESPAEEYQERVKLCLGFLYKIQSLEPYIRFSLPPGSGITGLFDTETCPTDMQVDCTQVQGQSTADYTTARLPLKLNLGQFKKMFGM